eukprot:1385214-Amphidinium_carterae.2
MKAGTAPPGATTNALSCGYVSCLTAITRRSKSLSLVNWHDGKLCTVAGAPGAAPGMEPLRILVFAPAAAAFAPYGTGPGPKRI